MKNFDWDEFKTGDIVVHCGTEEKANDFLEQANGYEIRWSKKRNLLECNHYDNYEENTCYRAQTSMRMGFADILQYMNSDYKIVEWEI